jgi:hypothetical protein
MYFRCVHQGAGLQWLYLVTRPQAMPDGCGRTGAQEDGGADRMDDDAYSAHLRRMMRERRQAAAAGASMGAASTARATAGPARPTAEQREQSRSASQAEAERLTREEEEKDRRWRMRVSQGKGWQERRAKYFLGWYERNLRERSLVFGPRQCSFHQVPYTGYSDRASGSKLTSGYCSRYAFSSHQRLAELAPERGAGQQLSAAAHFTTEAAPKRNPGREQWWVNATRRSNLDTAAVDAMVGYDDVPWPCGEQTDESSISQMVLLGVPAHEAKRALRDEVKRWCVRLGRLRGKSPMRLSRCAIWLW